MTDQTFRFLDQDCDVSCCAAAVLCKLCRRVRGLGCPCHSDGQAGGGGGITEMSLNPECWNGAWAVWFPFDAATTGYEDLVDQNLVDEDLVGRD